MKYHPDINKSPDATKMMSEINEAYNVLSDPDKRKKYDMYGSLGANADDFSGNQAYYTNQNAQDFSGGFNGSIFDDILNNFFGGNTDTIFNRGGRRESATTVQGTDIAFEVELTIEEAISGKKIETEVDKFEVCDICKGTGAKNEKAKSKCPACNGTGKIMQVQETMFGSFRNVSVCPNCRGKGTIITEKCTKCFGTGRIRIKKKIVLEIPQATIDGTKIRYRGMGNAGEQGGGSGDLYLYIKIKPHALYERKGNNLFYTAEISYPKAVLGTTINVNTPYGSENMKIPPGTEAGREFTIRGRGMPYPGNINRKGDFIIRIKLKIPNSIKLGKEAKKLIEDLDKLV
jgi:molecular chaperone DnaJ